MKKHLGFSLIELMIVVGIIGVLAAIAYPAYMQSVYRTNRAEAKSWLTDVDQRFQRCFTAYGKYDDATNCGVYTQLQGAAVITTKDRGFYEIKLSNLTSTAYDLTATAVLSPQTNDTSPVDCTVMTLSSKGVKTPIECW